MGLKITASSLVAKSSIEVDNAGVTVYEGAAFAAKRTYPFDKIDAILLSPQNELSVHVGTEVFSLPVQPNLPRHREVIDALMREVARASTPGSKIGALPPLPTIPPPGKYKEDAY